MSTKIVPRAPPDSPQTLSTSRIIANKGDRTQIEEHIHDVIDEFEHGIGRKATQSEIASIISSVTDHSVDSSQNGNDDDDESNEANDHDHNHVARRLSLGVKRKLSLAEDELAAAQAQFNLLSKQLSAAADIHGDKHSDDFGKTLTEKALAKYRAEKFVAEVKEGLDDNYQDTPWVVPSVAKAFQHRRYAMFASGHAPIWSTSEHDLASFGIGISLYLRLLKKLIISFLLMTFLSIPSFLFSTAGSKIPLEDRDPLGFSLVSVGNIGDSLESEVADQVIINGTLFGASSSTRLLTIPIWLGDPLIRMNAADASLIIVFCDLLCCMVFISLSMWLKGQITNSESGEGKETLSASDYTIYVRGLPSDATKQEIVAHFSNLYALDRSDWNFKGYCCCLGIYGKKSRLPDDITDRGSIMYDVDGNQVMVVQTIKHGTTLNVDNTRDDLYIGTWIAECTVIHPNSDLIAEHQKEKLTDIKLKIARAHVKKYASSTPAKGGPDPEKEKYWLKEVDKYSSNHIKTSHSIKRHQSVVSRKNRECSGAFITFQHEESFLRALSDYKRSTTCLGRLLQPNVLRFRPKRGTDEPNKNKVPLIVEQADEPTNIIWEHLNTSKKEINIRRCCTVLPCLLLLIIAMLVVFYVQEQGRIFKESTPSIAACKLDIPATYMDSYDMVTMAASSKTGLNPYLSTELTKKLCNKNDDGTTKKGGKKIYISYVNSTLNVSGWTIPRLNDYKKGFNNSNYTSSIYSKKACVNPCVDPSDTTKCDTRACEENPKGNLCRSFTRNSIVGCYCKGRLEQGISVNGYNEEMIQEFKEVTGDTCDTWLASYIANIAANVGMTVLIVVVNVVLRILLTILAKSEHHHSEGAESSAISMKVFAATFLNTAFTMLIVNSAFQNVFPTVLTSIGIGNGSFTDFSSEWYARVGSAFCLTMLLNIVTPNIITWTRLLCLDECKRAKMRKTAVTQRQLNISYSGAIFKLEYRYPTLLNVTFVTFLYSSGMPILYPIAAFIFLIMYFTDKIALLRLYNRPPMYKASLAKKTLDILPIAIILHCAIAVWMYGSDTLESYSLIQIATTYMGNHTNDQSGKFLKGNSTNNIVSFDKQFNIFERLRKINALIPFILLLLITVWYVLKILVWWWITWLTQFLCKIFTCGQCGSTSSVFPKRKYLPGYTEEHVMYVSDGSRVRLTQVEKEQGWVCKENEDGITMRYKVWMRDGSISGLRHRKGSKKTTWEVIRDTALHTYDIAANPNYADAFESNAARRRSRTMATGAMLGAGSV